MSTVATDETSDPTLLVETANSFRFAWRVLRADPRAWLNALAMWTAFFTAPLLTGFVLKAVLDRLPPSDGAGLWAMVALLGGMEAGRWVLLFPAIIQWHGAFVFWHTVPRVNALRSLGQDPGPVTGRLPESPGEAVSRFRDDARSIAEVLDVWLDMVAAIVAATIGVAVLFLLAPEAGVAMLVPTLAVLVFGQLLAGRLRRWRWIERRATARVTGFIGDVFGSISAVKVAAGEADVLRRFDALGQRRALAAHRDQVGTQLSQVLGGITANAGLGLTLLVIAPAVRGGDLTPGDIGLLTTYATVVAGLPRVTARWWAWQRQGDVSAARLGRLMVDGEPDGASAAVTTHLRTGPPVFSKAEHPARSQRAGGHRLDRLSVRDLVVGLDRSDQLHGIDLDVARGEFVVITGPVGAGKSVLLRAILGLVPTDGGTVTWNGTLVDEPSTWFVPPRAAYVPQVPRLFSEPLAETVLLGLPPNHLPEALRLACLDEDLTDMPDGTASLVGPKGVRLSGGQIQRTAAARALVRRPELLVVDDLSSALDVTTEARIWDNLLSAATGDVTVLAVSHRPPVLDRADRVIVLDQGRRTV